MKTILHPRVVLAAPRSKIPTLLVRANAIHDAMSAASSTFTAPTPPMPTLLSLIQALSTAQQAAGTRGAGLAATRDLRATDVVNALATERGYVQALVDAAPDQSAHLAGLAAMSIATSRPFAKPVLALSLVEPAGTVLATAHAAVLKQGRGKNRSTLYNWRVTADGGKTFTTAPPTSVARATLTGLSPMTTYGVQVCITDAEGTTAWSQTVSILVH